ncbi:MAG: M48 family metalloprotease [Acetatifactor sp.]|nr:M48 family metalloprotease [Acetatifactor sp.]
MTGEFMTGVFNTSLVMGLSIAAAAILLRAGRKRYSAGCRKRIWIYMAFCLLIPFHLFRFPGAYTAEIPDVVLREFESQAVNGAEEQEMEGGDVQSTQNQTGQNPSVQSQTEQNQVAQNQPVQNSSLQASGQGISRTELTVMDVLFAVWACVGVLLAVYFTVGYRRMRSRIRRWGSECEDGHVQEIIREAAAECKLKRIPEVRIMKDSDAGPFTTGVLRNTIILPDDALQERDMRFILKHEVIHCRNHDIFWRLFFLAVNIIHWFNPLVWYLRKAAEQDMEIACDEKVVSMASGEDRREYSDVILSWVERSRYRGSAVSTGYVKGVGFLKRRFDSIFSGGKKKNGILLTGGICILALFISCAVRLQSGGRVYAENSEDAESAPNAGNKIVSDHGWEVRTDVDGDGEADRVHVSDNNIADWDSVETYLSVNFSSGESVGISYPGRWMSYLVTGDLSGNGAADIILVKTNWGSPAYTGEFTVLHVETDEAGKPEVLEYPDNFIQNPDLEPKWIGTWEDCTRDKSILVDPGKWYFCMGAAVIEKDGKTMLRLIELVDGGTMSAGCIDCSYTAEGWYIEDMQMIYAYGVSEWEEALLGYTWGLGKEAPEPVEIRTFTEKEVEIIPQVEQYDFATAMETGTIQQQLRGNLPGAGEGVWYTILIDGVEYFYGSYDDFLSDETELFEYAIVSGEYSLANGISVGMTKEELLERYPNLRMEDMKGTVLNGAIGHMGWNNTAYPRSMAGLDEELDYDGAEYYYWDSQFDYIMIAEIEQDPDTLPISVALMMKDDVVAAITFYYPTAG